MKREVKKKDESGISEESLSIELTTRCNLACSHCFLRVKESEPYDLSLELCKKAITEGYSEGYRHLHFTGGEPLLWGGLIETVVFAFDMGYMSVFLNTNATLLTKGIVRRLADFKGLSISVSLEGTRVLHDTLRGKKIYEQTERGIKLVLDAGIEIIIFTIACKSLLADLSHFAIDLHNRYPGVKCLTLIQLFSVDEIQNTLSQELLKPEDFIKLVRIVSLLNLFGYKTTLLNNPLASVTSKLLEMPWIPRSRPLYRDGSMIIMANRDICLAHSSRENFGKYESGMIKKVLASQAYRNAVAPDKNTCPSCKYNGLCVENEMLRPSGMCWDGYNGEHYCKRVISRIVQKD